jgi:hypothetical protein
MAGCQRVTVSAARFCVLLANDPPDAYFRHSISRAGHAFAVINDFNDQMFFTVL